VTTWKQENGRCLTFSCGIKIFLDFKRGNAEIELTIFTKRFLSDSFSGQWNGGWF
jgi:hypothetical protein